MKKEESSKARHHRDILAQSLIKAADEKRLRVGQHLLSPQFAQHALKSWLPAADFNLCEICKHLSGEGNPLSSYSSRLLHEPPIAPIDSDIKGESEQLQSERQHPPIHEIGRRLKGQEHRCQHKMGRQQDKMVDIEPPLLDK